jgi:hypothetical protein
MLAGSFTVGTLHVDVGAKKIDTIKIYRVYPNCIFCLSDYKELFIRKTNRSAMIA